MMFRTLLVVLGLLATGAPLQAAPAGDGLRQAKVYLVRLADGPDGDATGQLRIRSKPGKNDERFEVVVHDVNGQLTHFLWVEDALGEFREIAALSGTYKGPGSTLGYRAKTKAGEGLPLGVDGVEAFLGRSIQIRRGGHVVLRGTLPDEFPTNCKVFKTKASLVRPDTAPDPDPDAVGRLTLRSSPGQGREGLAVDIAHATFDADHDLWMENPAGSGDLDHVGRLLRDGGDDDHGGQSGQGGDKDLKYKADTKKGDQLPFDAPAEDLLGRRVQVRVAGQVVLRGELPDHFSGPSHNKKARADLTRPDDAPDPDAHGKVDLRWMVHKSREWFDVRANDVHVGSGEQASVWVEDAHGDMRKIANLTGGDDDDDDDDHHGHPSEGEFRYSVDTKQGQSLPFGVATNAELFGRRVQIRRGDAVILRGTVPDGFPSDGKRPSERRTLDVADGSPDPSVRGLLKLSSRPGKGDERIEMRLRRAPFDTRTFHVFIQTDLTGDPAQDVGEVQRLGKSGKGRWRRWSKLGQALPQDIEAVFDLAGRRIEVRDDDGALYLIGEVPSPGG